MKALLLALFLATPLWALAHDYEAGSLTIGHPMIAETPPMARSAAGYLSITNDGTEADTLIAVETAIASASIHRSEVVEGIARMASVDHLDIPAGETVTLEPGGLHVMLTGLDAPLAAEDRIPATLVFERAGRVEVVFNVEARANGAQEPSHEH